MPLASRAPAYPFPRFGKARGTNVRGSPVTIGSVTISTGDYLLADRDGVVIIPHAIVEEVVRKTEEVVATESEMRSALIPGIDPVEAYNNYGKF